MNNISSPLRKIRRELGLSLKEVSSSVGTTHSHLSRIERGGTTTRNLASKLSNFFDQNISEMEILYPERFTQE
jgi:transcriptional regulator with XRE-family HTH domain